MAPTGGVVGVAGPVVPGGGAAVALGAGVVMLGRGVGNVGSTGPAPGAATGLPSMVEVQPSINAGLASTGTSSSEPPARLRRTFCDNCTRRSRKFSDPALRVRKKRRKLL